MKITKLFIIAGLISGAASLSLAGPGLQFWQAQTQRAEERAKVAADAPKSEKTDVTYAPSRCCVACNSCNATKSKS